MSAPKRPSGMKFAGERFLEDARFLENTCGDLRWRLGDPRWVASWRGMHEGFAALARRELMRQFVQLHHLPSELPRRLGVASMLGLVALVAVAGSRAWAENEDVTVRRNLERLAFSDAEIAHGFSKIALGAELRFAGDANPVRKFDGPVRVFLDSRAHAERRARDESIGR